MSNLSKTTVQFALATGRDDEEADEKEIFREDVLSSTSPVDLTKDSSALEECGSRKGAFVGALNKSKGHVRFGPSDLQKLYLALSPEQQGIKK